MKLFTIVVLATLVGGCSTSTNPLKPDHVYVERAINAFYAAKEDSRRNAARRQQEVMARERQIPRTIEY